MLYALLVEDEPVNRRMLSSILKGWGYEVIEAGSVEEAKKLLSRSPVPDLALLDYHLGARNGIGPDIAHLLRGCHWQGIRIVSMSSTMGPDASWDPRKFALFDDVIAKPFPVERLREAIAIPRSP